MYIIKITLYYLINIIAWAIFARSLMTWVPNATNNPIYNFLVEITEPIEAPIRKILGDRMSGPIDFTPMIAMFLLFFISRMVMILL